MLSVYLPDLKELLCLCCCPPILCCVCHLSSNHGQLQEDLDTNKVHEIHDSDIGQLVEPKQVFLLDVHVPVITCAPQTSDQKIEQ